MPQARQHRALFRLPIVLKGKLLHGTREDKECVVKKRRKLNGERRQRIWMERMEKSTSRILDRFVALYSVVVLLDFC